MTRKRVFELAVLYVAVSVFAAIVYSLGAYQNARPSTIEVELVGCEPGPDNIPTAELQPL